MKCLLLFFSSILFVPVAKSQTGPLSYQFEIGGLVSFGPNHYRDDSVQINNITSISYADRLRFEHPSIRLRSAILYKIVERFSCGIEVGANLRLGESFYNNEVLYSIPLQTKLLYSIFDINQNYKLALDGTFGYHFRNYYKIPTTEQGGLIYSSSAILSTSKSRDFNWYAKIGFEKQTENLRRTIYARDPGQVNQDYKFRLNRNQLLLSFGLTLN